MSQAPRDRKPEALDPGDEAAAQAARSFVDEALLDRVWLHGALVCDPLRKRSEIQRIVDGDRVVGLSARTPDIFAQPLLVAAGRLPGAVEALLANAPRPFVCIVPQRHAPEAARAGGERVRTELQMARLSTATLPDEDERIAPVDDVDEIRRFATSDVPEFHPELGPFLGSRDAKGELAAIAGVRFVTPRIAFLAHVETREDERRNGLARAVVAALVRRVETPERTVLLQTREDNLPAQALYRQLGFRGSRRLILFAFS